MMRGANGGGTLTGDATVHVTYQPSAGASVRRGTYYLPSSNTRFYTVDAGQAVPIYVHNSDPGRLAFR